MLPTISIGPWSVSTYVLVHAFAFGVAVPLGFRRLQNAGYPPRWIAEGLSLTIASAIIGAVLFFRALGLAGAGAGLLQSGSTIFGAIAGGGLAGYAYCRWRRVSPGRAFDAGIVAVPLGQAIGRLGCLAAGCCYGKPTASWLALNLPGAGGVWQPRYPAQLMAASGDILILLLLLGFERWRRRRGLRACEEATSSQRRAAGTAAGGVKPATSRRGRGAGGGPPLQEMVRACEGVSSQALSEQWPFAGAVTVVYGGLYAIKRFAVELARADNRVVLAPFTWAHALAVCLLALVVVVFVWNQRRGAAGTGARSA